MYSVGYGQNVSNYQKLKISVKIYQKLGWAVKVQEHGRDKNTRRPPYYRKIVVNKV